MRSVDISRLVSRLRAHEPVAVRGMFAHQPITRLDTLARAIDRCGDVAMPLREDQHATFRRTGSLFTVVRARRTTLAGFGRHVEHAPHTSLKCAGTSIDKRLAELFTLPAVCGYGHRRELGVTIQCFAASAGGITQVHFDGGCYHTLIYQVFGRKRVVLFPPDAAQQLDPLLFVGLARLHEQAFAAALRGGIEIVLEPGSALYMPPLYWHFVEYLDTGLSLSVRFGMPREADALAPIHRNLQVQRVMADIARGTGTRARRQILRALARRLPTPLARYRHVQDCLDHECDVPPLTPARRLAEERQVRYGIRAGYLYREAAR